MHVGKSCDELGMAASDRIPIVYIQFQERSFTGPVYLGTSIIRLYERAAVSGLDSFMLCRKPCMYLVHAYRSEQMLFWRSRRNCVLFSIFLS